MSPLGVFEIFYGLPWSDQDRESYAEFLKAIGFEFYVYGPKADENLRRGWQNPLKSEDFNRYRAMKAAFTQKGLRFGLALSPQGLNGNLTGMQRERLRDKVSALSDLGLDILGLFFDDMKSAPEMAERQLEVAQLVQSATSAKILFCPSYYSYDSLLEMLFGDRPAGYLETLGKEMDHKIEILWTGEHIISPEITASHLRDVGAILRRKPFICDNFYANDGPINCNFLRVLPPSGRTRDVFAEASGWALNPMNQAHLSKLVLQAFSKYARAGEGPEAAFRDSLQTLCGPEVAAVLIDNCGAFAEAGLEILAKPEGQKLRERLALLVSPFANDIVQWLNGKYVFDLEGMIDQSCYDGT